IMQFGPGGNGYDKERQMTTGADIPVTVEPEAAEFIAQRGLNKQFEMMVARAKQLFTDLRRIEVMFDSDPTGNIPAAVLWAYREPESVGDSAEDQWTKWKLETFPPEVLLHLTLLCA